MGLRESIIYSCHLQDNCHSWVEEDVCKSKFLAHGDVHNIHVVSRGSVVRVRRCWLADTWLGCPRGFVEGVGFVSCERWFAS